jgi:hypothetical protein
MNSARSGLGSVLGPDGCCYALGGSVDGYNGLSSIERYDVREKKWEILSSSMCYNRGYIAACIGPNQKIYVSGGLHKGEFCNSMEVYDIRMNQWTLCEHPNNEFDRASHQMFFIL